MILELVLVVAVISLLLYLFNENCRPSKFPPGVWRLPVIGSLPFLKMPLHEHFTTLSKKYGKIFSLYIGNFPTVVISDANMIREAFKLDALNGRPDSRVFTERSWGKKRGIIFNEGKDWTEQRRFALKNLRDFGFGKGTMEQLILDEVCSFREYLKKFTGSPVSLNREFNLPVLNALWHLIAGERFSFDDQRLRAIIKKLVDNFKAADAGGAIFFFPWFTKLAPKLSGWEAFFSVLKPTMTFLSEPVDEHRKTFNPDNLRDLIDVYLNEISKTTDKTSGFYKDDGDKTIKTVMLDLFVAGAETVSTTLNYSLLYLINFPEVQEKLQKEIATNIGSKLPSLSDRPKMQYLEAFIAETLRYSSFVPNGVFHCALETVEFNGYVIPKGTNIFPNLWQVHFDEAVWGDPKNFRPDRFIDENGHYKKNDNLMPFSVGKRVCLGESLARDEIFLFLTSLLQKFSFEPEVKGSPPSMEASKQGGLILQPQEYKVVLKERTV
ncbi:Methyl farnesoate epoxidase [Orchesella cincta]|uniref:Methyl farnesoate epoxidase n=1 Tax=Orchesella cincta TaxID=48709 RepID=A0A1D2M962_ORCCI|nr:Methyl farnesoate epoxidase [Orchesella cincta]